MKSKEDKKQFYTYLRKGKADSNSLKKLWVNIKGACKGDPVFFAQAKGIIDQKIAFLRGLSAGKGNEFKSKKKNYKK